MRALNTYKMLYTTLVTGRQARNRAEEDTPAITEICGFTRRIYRCQRCSPVFTRECAAVQDHARSEAPKREPNKFSSCVGTLPMSVFVGYKIQGNPRRKHLSVHATTYRVGSGLEIRFPDENTQTTILETTNLPPLLMLNSQQFTSSDRRAVMESLLQREDVVAHLFDMFFPVALSAKGADPVTKTE